MSWIDDSVAEFGRGLDIDHLALNDRGLVSLVFERSGTLFLEQVNGYLLIYLTREIAAKDDSLVLRALSLCHYRNGHPYDLSAAMKGEDRLTFLARIPEREVSPPVLEAAFALLVQLQDRAAA
jgi:type III secretion chaperone SycN